MTKATDSKIAALKKKIGENIKKIRQNNNIEVKTLCADLEISASAYSNIERGVTDISISRIMQLAAYFSVHYSQILEVDNTTIYQMTFTNNDTNTQNNFASQGSSASESGYQIALKQANDENAFLRSQLIRLTELLVAKNEK